MEITGLLIATGALLLVALCWFGFHYLANGPMKNPDTLARITGNCGDTMEISLKFDHGKVTQARHYSDGCSISQQCIEGAALLALGKTLSQLREINMISIMELVGQLPETHLHCAQLAETTLQKAVTTLEKKQEQR